MYFTGRRNPVAVLSLLCILFWGMCFGNVQTDSSFACTDSPSSGLEGSSAASVLRPVGKSVPGAQAYTQKVLNQYENALVLRHAIRRTSPRSGRSSGFCLLLVSIISLLFPLLCVLRFHGDFHEIYSNTVIIKYIHHKDGRKA